MPGTLPMTFHQRAHAESADAGRDISGAHLLEVDRRADGHDVLDPLVFVRAGVEQRENAAHAVASERDRPSTAGIQRGAHGTGHVVEHVVVEANVFVFAIWYAKVHDEHVEASIAQRAHHGVLGAEIVDVGPDHQWRDQQQRNRVPLEAHPVHVRPQLEFHIGERPHSRDRELAALQHHVCLGGIPARSGRTLGEIDDAVYRRKHRAVDQVPHSHGCSYSNM